MNIICNFKRLLFKPVYQNLNCLWYQGSLRNFISAQGALLFRREHQGIGPRSVDRPGLESSYQNIFLLNLAYDKAGAGNRDAGGLVIKNHQIVIFGILRQLDGYRDIADHLMALRTGVGC